MRLKKLGAALVVVAALGAVLASSALAAAVTEDVKWYTGAGVALASSETISATEAGAATLTTVIAGTKYKMQSTSIECVECKIENSGGTAIGSGKLKFKGLTVVEPAGCTVASEITTKALSIQADWMSGTTNYVRFVPTAGETTAFVTFEITGCALATTINAKGTLFAQSVNATGTQVVSQQVNSSEAINSAAGGTFKVGTEKAALEASFIFRLSGTKTGVAFGTNCATCGVEGLPNETTVWGYATNTEGGKEVPAISWVKETPIDTKGCVGGKVTIIVEGENIKTHEIEKRETTLKETGVGKFTGNIPVPYPIHGHGTVKITVTGCEKPAEELHLEFKCWIDPSGKVVDGNHENAPLWEATVTLLSSATEKGTYTAVPNGSEVMSPGNRVNPDKSHENGAFGWDVVEGWYKVEATKTGCGTATTEALFVPPPKENLEIVLHCEGEQWKLGEATGEIAQLAVTKPAKSCEGKVRVENVSFGPAAIRVLKETGIECTLKKVCEGKTLAKAEKCETEAEKPGTKPEYELEVEWNGKKFTKKFSV